MVKIMAEVIVYSTSTCPWCIRLKKFLDDNHVQYKSYDVASDNNAREEMLSKTGQFAVPVIDIGGNLAIGFDEKWLREKLNLIQSEK